MCVDVMAALIEDACVQGQRLAEQRAAQAESVQAYAGRRGERGEYRARTSSLEPSKQIG